MAHEKSIQKLVRLAKALNIKVVKTEYDGDAAWVPSRRVIKIDKDLDSRDVLGSLLHELGHVFDELTTKELTIISRVYSRVYTDKVTKKDVEIVLLYEKRAWNIGETLADFMNIKLGKWFYEGKKDSLKSYKDLI